MDLALSFDNEAGIGDLVIENDDLKIDEGLETAVLISLYTDARVSDEELPAEEAQKRGWWGDIYPDIPNDQIGSKLWLKAR